MAIAGFIVVTSYNAVVALRQRIDKAWANIDVVLKQRHDQLPNLVAAVRGLMAFEQDVLTRGHPRPEPPTPRRRRSRTRPSTSDATSSAVRSLFAVVEHYPDLKSQANVADLQDEIERLEAMIADRRELYNDQVYRYNTRIAQVPGVVPRSGLRLAAREFFAAEPAESSDQAGHRRDCGRLTMSRPTTTDGAPRSGWSATARRSGRGSAGTPVGPTSRLTDRGREQARALGAGWPGTRSDSS